MEQTGTEGPILITTTVRRPLEEVWQKWTGEEHIVHWNAASDDWHTPHAVNELWEGGSIRWHMEARDGSIGFDFEGSYETVLPHKLLRYRIADGRSVEIRFEEHEQGTIVTESFEAEGMNSRELQQQGWQAILDRFRDYAEGTLK